MKLGPYAVCRSWRAAVLILSAVLSATGCQEDLGSGAACATLCPDTLTLKDTVLEADSVLAVDSTLVGFPPLGTESNLLVANYEQGANRVQSVAVLRFDKLAYTVTTDTTQPPKPVVRVDTSSVVLNVLAPPTGQDTIYVQDTIVFQVFDVDVDAPDFDTASVHQRFLQPPIATRAVPPDSAKGQIRILLDTGFVAQRVRAGGRIRLGISAVSNKDFRLRISSFESGGASELQYAAYAADSSRQFMTVLANTKASQGATISALADYMLVVEGSPPPPAGVLTIGGLPSSRVFLRFNIPPALIDSATTIVRANLELWQIGSPNFLSTDSLSIVPRVVRATNDVTDVGQAAVLVQDASFLNLKAIQVLPEESRRDTLPLVNLTRLWRSEATENLQRAIVLQSSGEGTDPRQIFFASPQAADPDLRPRLRLSYIPRSGFGLP